jgi:hypothetical protein
MLAHLLHPLEIGNRVGVVRGVSSLDGQPVVDVKWLERRNFERAAGLAAVDRASFSADPPVMRNGWVGRTDLSPPPLQRRGRCGFGAAEFELFNSTSTLALLWLATAKTCSLSSLKSPAARERDQPPAAKLTALWRVHAGALRASVGSTEATWDQSTSVSDRSV